ncbi:hypothetical protein EVAR_6964_1 [Eumeta japonica]|uniref:Uncharacterized protein n=1 Tax=Eumeta variegata TaxID=151549 RepID=A0A4C1THF0_EUMVA|nr:hypothetical protein EVAR_6964_1 [Eumeta japonica]
MQRHRYVGHEYGEREQAPFKRKWKSIVITNTSGTVIEDLCFRRPCGSDRVKTTSAEGARRRARRDVTLTSPRCRLDSIVLSWHNRSAVSIVTRSVARGGRRGRRAPGATRLAVTPEFIELQILLHKK